MPSDECARSHHWMSMFLACRSHGLRRTGCSQVIERFFRLKISATASLAGGSSSLDRTETRILLDSCARNRTQNPHGQRLCTSLGKKNRSPRIVHFGVSRAQQRQSGKAGWIDRVCLFLTWCRFWRHIGAIGSGSGRIQGDS